MKLTLRPLKRGALLRWATAFAVFAATQTTTFAQTDLKIGSNPGAKNSSAILELESTSKGLLLPRLTTVQMDAIATPAEGLTIYNTTDGCIYIRKSGSWANICDPIGLGAWSVTGNNNINAATNFLGTTNGQPVIFKTNAVERGRFDANGNFGIGTATPANRLDVDASSAGNPIRLQGLQAGVVADSMVTSNAGVLRRMSFADLLAGNLSATNGINLTSGVIRLGGALTQATTITATAVNTLAIDGLQGGAATDSVVTAVGTNGVLRRRTVADLLKDGNAWLNGGNTLTSTGTFGTNSNHNFNVVTNGVTRLTFENNGNITQSGTGTVTFTGPTTATNGFNATGATTLNTTGAGATNIGNASSTTTVLGTTNINTTGAGVTTIGNASSTTNIAGNTLNLTNTPTVTTATGNNVALVDQTTGQVRNITVDNLVGNVVTADNGLTKTSPANIRLGGTLMQNTTVAQAGFTMAYTGGNVGVGTATPNSTFQVTGSQAVSVLRTTASVTLDATHYIVLANATGGAVTLTLPAAGTNAGRTYYIGKSDESTNTVTFSPALRLTETTTVASLNFAKKYKIVSDGTDWVIYNE
jgi:hypothetical protein